MRETSMRTEIQCDDHAELLSFERTIWAKDDELLEFSIMDSYIGNRQYQGLLGRFRRAWNAFIAKPICYAGVVVMEKDRARSFLNKCLDILNSDAGGIQHEANDPAEQPEQKESERISC